MSARRVLVLATAVGLVLLVLVPIGRWERDRRADDELRGMRGVVAAIGDLDSPALNGFRVLAHFDCLLYERGANDFALEVCVDREGRVVEAIDRRGDEPRIWSLRDDPTSSELTVDRLLVDKLLVEMGVPVRVLRER